MKRGDLVTIALSGDYGQPRPGLITQSDVFAVIGSIVIVPVTSHILENVPFRIDVPQGAASGLRKPSQIMVDKVAAVPATKIRSQIGVIDDDTLSQVEQALALLLGFGRKER